MDYEQCMYEAKRDGKLEEKRKIVKKMMEKNMPIETIMELVELSKEELDKILKE